MALTLGIAEIRELIKELNRKGKNHYYTSYILMK